MTDVFDEIAKKKNETASSRCIGLTVETRPDWFRLQHADRVLNLGTTRVELGIQTIFDDVLNKMERGHTVTDSINATRIGKESGFKICYHMMPGLFNSDIKKDIDYYSKLTGIKFENFDGTAKQLGIFCGKPFSIAVLAIK
jgi:elongator complex protein 3